MAPQVDSFNPEPAATATFDNAHHSDPAELTTPIAPIKLCEKADPVMKITSFHIGCLILTCVVVHTCVRIEILNARYSYYLPRTDLGGGNPKWRVAADSLVRRNFERSIAMERQAKFAEEHPGEPIPEHTEFLGPPYTASQQAEIDTALDENQRRSALYNWVRGMGFLQYVLAPAALFWSADIARIERSRSVRIAAAIAGLVNLTCIALMFYRGYFTSLGW